MLLTPNAYCSSGWVDSVSQHDLTIIVDGLNEDLRFADGQIIKAILSFPIPVFRVVGIRSGLRGDSTPPTRDDTGDAHVVLGIVIRKPQPGCWF